MSEKPKRWFCKKCFARETNIFCFKGKHKKGCYFWQPIHAHSSPEKNLASLETNPIKEQEQPANPSCTYSDERCLGLSRQTGELVTKASQKSLKLECGREAKTE